MGHYETEVERFTADPEEMRLFQQERLILETTELIARLMEERHVPKAELGRRLSRSRAYVSKLLSGRTNMTLRSISDALWALNASLCVGVGPLTVSPASAYSAPVFCTSIESPGVGAFWASFSPVAAGTSRFTVPGEPMLEWSTMLGDITTDPAHQGPAVGEDAGTTTPRLAA